MGARCGERVLSMRSLCAVVHDDVVDGIGHTGRKLLCGEGVEPLGQVGMEREGEAMGVHWDVESLRTLVDANVITDKDNDILVAHLF